MPADLRSFRNSIVRVCSHDGEFFGLGYRLSEELVLTCAHVVAEAFGDADPKSPPEGAIRLEHPRFDATREVSGDGEDLEATVEPGGWFPQGVRAGPRDLALLRLREGSGSPPGPLALLTGAISLGGVDFTIYGGVKGHEENLVPVEGVVRQPVGTGRWQLGSETEYTVEPGCSGGPAVDRSTGRVIGLIVQDEEDSAIRAGFLIPARELREALQRAGIALATGQLGLGSVRAWAKRRIPPPHWQERESVLRFIDHYAGRTGAPMPFAGRQEELTRLHAWWESGGGSFLLVSGPAGRGKSALLLHWLATVLERQEAVGVVFVPISIRFGTREELAGLRLLHAQLAGLFSELRFPEGARPDRTDYRSRIQEGWRTIANAGSERYLVVVDGADEAGGDWPLQGLLPYEVAENLAVIVSARHKPGELEGRSWIEDFALGPAVEVPEPLELEPLERTAVGEAMAQLGHPLDGLVEREEMLEELYRLTEGGDPLLVTLWAGQLWGERKELPELSPEDLATLDPGFGKYLDRWMREQELLWKAEGIELHPDDLDRLLGILAYAHAPLRLEHLLAVERRVPSPSRWEYRQARRVLDLAGRLVVGDAERSGYTFVHPRLAEEFRARTAGVVLDASTVRSAYADWGAEVVAVLNSGELEPKWCPEYVLRHFVDHVLETRVPVEEMLERYLLPLLESGWHRAWYEGEGVYDGFLTDLMRVEEILLKSETTEDAPIPYLGELIRCALMRSSINSLTQQLPAELLVSLVVSGLWGVERALRLTARFENKRTVKVIEGLTTRGKDRLTDDTVNQMVELAESIVDEFSRARALAMISGRLRGGAGRYLLERALSAAEGVEDEWERAVALSSVAAHLEGAPRCEVLERALAAADGIEDGRVRARTLSSVAALFTGAARLTLLEHALSAVEGIEQEGRAWSLSSVVKHLAGERALLGRALSAAEEIESRFGRAWALSSVAEHLQNPARRDVLKRALSAAEGIATRSRRAEALSFVAAQLEGSARRVVLERALSATEGIESRLEFNQALSSVAAHLGEESDLVKRALVAAERIEDKWRSAEAIASVAAQLEGPARHSLLEQALSVTEGIEGAQTRSNALACVAAYLAGEDGLLERALSVAEGIENEWARAEALSAVAAQLSGETTLLEQALSAAEGIEEAWARAKALSSVAAQLEGPARRALLERALSVAEGIENEGERAWTLARMVEHLAVESGLLERALSAVEGIEDEGDRARSLSRVAASLAGEDRLLERALSVAEGIENERPRAEALSAVAAQLSGETTLLEQALSAAEGIEEAWARAKALSSVAAQLEGPARRALLEPAVSAAEGIKRERPRAEALSAVAAQLEGSARVGLLEQAVSVAEKIENTELRAWELASVAAQLESSAQRALLERAALVAEGIEDTLGRAEVLVLLLSKLSGAEQGRLVKKLVKALGEIERESALKLIANWTERAPALWGTREATATAEAIIDTTSYWP